MIDEKKIQEAAAKCYEDKYHFNYAATLADDDSTPLFEEGDIKNSFICGINWFKQSIWHDASEVPEEDKIVITEYEDCAGVSYEIDCNDGVNDWGENVKNYNIKRWCCISDLLPKGGEE